MKDAAAPILDLAHRQGLLRPRDVEAFGFSRMALSTLAREGKLTRLCRGCRRAFKSTQRYALNFTQGL